MLAELGATVRTRTPSPILTGVRMCGTSSKSGSLAYCLHALVGRILAMARASAGWLLTVGEPLDRGPRAKADRGLQQRAFDEAALAGALAFVKGGENTRRC